MKLVAALLGLTLVSWPIDRVEQGMARLTWSEGDAQCSAFAIRESPATWITASHCLPEAPTRLRLDGVYALDRVLDHGQSPDDLAVFTVTPKTGARPLALGPSPKRGDDVLQIGYGAGSYILVFYPGVLITQEFKIGHRVDQLTSATGMPGMSGGPVVDRRGRAVGVVMGAVQPSTDPARVAYGPTYARLKAVYDRFAR